jgi:phage terminase large subunit-like protein
MPQSEFNAALLEALDEKSWAATARPNQRPPDGDWTTWLLLAGRGFGKTRAGAEYIIDLVSTGQARRVALVAATAADVRDVMVEGSSGIYRLFTRLEPTGLRAKQTQTDMAQRRNRDDVQRRRKR